MQSGGVFGRLLTQPGAGYTSRNPTHFPSVAHRPDIKLATIASSSAHVYALAQGVKPEQIIIIPNRQVGAATVIDGRVGRIHDRLIQYSQSE
ncbi:hypothetical protein [Bradyrhizobium sp. DASA03007]|uniref:hypothetical protein n=1 Tax=unclassified Bradyrhizobium TaxID=2631580 RepID=UPI003F72C3BE